MVTPLNDRAKLRLRLAAGILRGRSKARKVKSDLPVSRENFYVDMIALLDQLPKEEQADLKELVDWLEQYAAEEQRLVEKGWYSSGKKRST